MQLGELQSQIERFERRDVAIIAVSVDSPTDSLAMIERLGLTFHLASDPDQRVVRAFRVQNPDTQELALHAAYIVDGAGEIFYRKVARRRPVSAELIDAIDAHRDVYPQQDRAAPPQRIAVAYPQNEFQALLELSAVEMLPASIDPAAFREVLSLVTAGRGDDALFAFKRLIQASSGASDEDRYDAAAWLVRQRFFPDDGPHSSDAMAMGRDLRRRLDRVAELERLEQVAAGTPEHDELLHTLAAARAGLTRVRAGIGNRAGDWNLRYAKTSLRSYREVVRAALRAEGTR